MPCFKSRELHSPPPFTSLRVTLRSSGAVSLPCCGQGCGCRTAGPVVTSVVGAVPAGPGHHGGLGLAEGSIQPGEVMIRPGMPAPPGEGRQNVTPLKPRPDVTSSHGLAGPAGSGACAAASSSVFHRPRCSPTTYLTLHRHRPRWSNSRRRFGPSRFKRLVTLTCDRIGGLEGGQLAGLRVLASGRADLRINPRLRRSRAARLSFIVGMNSPTSPTFSASAAHSYEEACQAFAAGVPGLCRALTFGRLAGRVRGRAGLAPSPTSGTGSCRLPLPAAGS